MHDHLDLDRDRPYGAHPGFRDEQWLQRYGEPAAPGLDRLTHLVLVDGRLVDVWSEPVAGTAWAHHARRFDTERRPAPPPPKPAHQELLEWLDAVCGGRAAVLALDDTPLTDDGLAPPDLGETPDGVRPVDCLTALELVTARLFDDEVGVALRRALARVCVDDAPTVLSARSADVVAGGVCWAVGKANGLFRPAGGVAMQQVKELLDRPGTLSVHGQRVRRALHGFRGWSLAMRPPPGPGVPDLQPLGHADLLLGSVRGELARLRDRALSAQDEDEFHRAG